jgi:bacillolysin
MDVDAQRSVVRFQQLKAGVPIMGGELIVHLDNARNIQAVMARTIPSPAINTTPAITPAAAAQTALAQVARTAGNASALRVSTPELWIYDPSLIGPGSALPRLVWRMEVTSTARELIRELVLVDAQRGSIALHFNQIETAKNRMTYNASNGLVLPGTLVCNEANTCLSPPNDSHVAAAHLYAGDTYDFYASNFGRDSLDNAGLTLTSVVHFDSGYQNAYWDGAEMVYGDGSGFPLADDVVAHELTHGVTQYTSNLFYYYQAGAINESLSDVFGEFVDLTNGRGTDTAAVRWLIGEDVSGLGAIRSMKDPPAFGDPDKMTSDKYATDFGDNGGVHTNSGINNKAAFLMVDGGTFNGQTVTGIGIPKVAKIYYETATHLLTSGSDYLDLYNALFQGCTNLIGTSGITSGDCTQVRNATLAVEMNLQPVAGFNPEAPICTGGATPVNVFFDNLESGSTNFAFSAAVGTLRWQYDSLDFPFAHSGVHFLYADDYPDTTTDTAVAMAASVAIPAGAFLHFAHAFGFANYDAGVVEYSTNAGVTWTDAGSFFDSNGYTGIVNAASGNPLAGRSAFVDESHGYISSRLNLSSLAGQSVRFRWRMGLDSDKYKYGWWLDDVRIYTCKRRGQVISN